MLEYAFPVVLVSDELRLAQSGDGYLRMIVIVGIVGY